jgi:hypothetical protein
VDPARPTAWAGHVNGEDAYTVLALPDNDWQDDRAFVSRVGVRNGSHMTHVGRAMDLAELQEEMPSRTLQARGLLLPTA